MQAIVTKFHGPTDNRGARISATCDAKRIYVGFHYGSTDPHDIAAATLIVKLGWQDHGSWTKGGLPNNGGNVYVCTPAKYSESLDLNAATAPERE